MYERLTELSFDFWDRTQSGQVISRANTDIRSIQLLLPSARSSPCRSCCSSSQWS